MKDVRKLVDEYLAKRLKNERGNVACISPAKVMRYLMERYGLKWMWYYDVRSYMEKLWAEAPARVQAKERLCYDVKKLRNLLQARINIQ